MAFAVNATHLLFLRCSPTAQHGHCKDSMKRVIVIVLALVVSTVSLLAVDDDKAAYVGGTLDTINVKAEGTFSTQSPTNIVFTAKDAAPLVTPYENITALEYGQKAGRRVALAVLVSPFALFPKKRNHYLSYTDQTGVAGRRIELERDIVRTMLTVVEVRFEETRSSTKTKRRGRRARARARRESRYEVDRIIRTSSGALPWGALI